MSAKHGDPGVRWDDLRLLLAAARAGSFLAAGRALGVATSTLSRGLGRLEDAVGTTLLERRADGVRPTAAGRRLLETAEELELRLGARVRELPADASGLEGTIRISAGDGFVDFLADVVAAFLEGHPGVSFELAIESRPVDLARREADLALRTRHGREASLVYQTLGVLPYGLYASSAYLHRHGAPRSLAALARHRFVGFAPPLAKLPAMQWLRRHGATQFPVRATSFGAQLAAARAGVGIAIVPDRLADGLERVLPRARPEPLTVYLAGHPDARRLAHVRAFSDALRLRFRELAAAG
jgi:DNA-binding transcriptional LysR family regulator